MRQAGGIPGWYPTLAHPDTFLKGTKTMHRRILTAFLALGLTGAGPVLAEDLIQIYDLAVLGDPLLKKAEQQLLATREVKPQALALLLPNIGVTASGQYQNIEALDVPDGLGGSRTKRESFGSGQGTALLNQTVYNRGQWIGLQRSADVISQAEAEYKTSQIQLMARTVEAYFNVLRAADLVRSSEALMRATR